MSAQQVHKLRFAPVEESSYAWNGLEVATFVLLVILVVWSLHRLRSILRDGVQVAMALPLIGLGLIACPIAIVAWDLSPLHAIWLAPALATAGLLAGMTTSGLAIDSARLVAAAVAVGLQEYAVVYNPRLQRHLDFHALEVAATDVRNLTQASCEVFFERCVSALEERGYAGRGSKVVRETPDRVRAENAMMAFALPFIIHSIEHSTALTAESRSSLCAAVLDKFLERTPQELEPLIERYQDEAANGSTRLIRFAGDVATAITGQVAPIMESLVIMPIAPKFVSSCKYGVGTSISDSHIVAEAVEERDAWLQNAD